MNLGEGFREAWDTIRHNKLRTFLTMFGMNIGVAAVVAVMATGLMGRGAVMSGIEGIGSNLVWVSANRDAYEERSNTVLMRPDDLEAINLLAGDAAVSAVLRGNVSLGSRGEQSVVSLFGVSSAYPDIWNRRVDSGRFFSRQDDEMRRKVIVLGANTSRYFFDSPDEALSRSIVVDTTEFTVIGVMPDKERSPIDDGTDDDTCFVPQSVYSNMYDWSALGGPRVFQVVIKVRDLDDREPLVRLVERYLGNRYGTHNEKPRFRVETAEDSIDTTNQVFDVITTVITLIAGISLLVGGIGIMNIMLVTVTERTREIGIRKSIGAKRRDILGQFLVESVFICLIGGGFGVITGIGIAILVSVAQNWVYLLPLGALALGLSVSLAIGLFFGIYPAVKAARLDPVAALTKE